MALLGQRAGLLTARRLPLNIIPGNAQRFTRSTLPGEFPGNSRLFQARTTLRRTGRGMAAGYISVQNAEESHSNCGRFLHKAELRCRSRKTAESVVPNRKTDAICIFQSMRALASGVSRSMVGRKKGFSKSPTVPTGLTG